MNKDAGGDISDKLAALCSRAGLETVLNGIGEGFYAVDCDWRVVLFNDEAALRTFTGALTK